MSSWSEEIVKGIFEGGVNTTTLVLLNVILLLLFLPIFALLYLTLKAGFAYGHVIVFLLLAIGLLVSINWFVYELGLNKPGAPEGDQQKDTATNVSDPAVATNHAKSNNSFRASQKCGALIASLPNLLARSRPSSIIHEGFAAWIVRPRSLRTQGHGPFFEQNASDSHAVGQQPYSTLLQQAPWEPPDLPKGTHVAVGISGGVDSAVTALLLKQKGYKVTGVFMKNWDEAEERAGACQSERDRQDAREICALLGIPLRETEFVQDYWHKVFEQFLTDCAKGLTPNPDLACNRHIKFDALLDWTRTLGAEWLATGHYARLRHTRGGEVQLLQGVDTAKDQTYFLASVGGKALRNVLFPLGHLHKHEVRAIAAAAGISQATKKSSVGICFVGKRPFAEFVAQYIEMAPGRFRDVEGGGDKGPHKGIAAYTSGQRARIGGQHERWYVVGKHVGANEVVICRGG
eukprot:CAMPEP_0198221292 /NCGR_PEP_ID=MMETSP1445-20131203/83053_1 /TAXON_ID=36898 /ORGANISM="Pyramimonas sp., Strain CCMP2087" /LENGTH=459 /DNA_ID=CAMNT_0043899381 /DNA_START=127 /DNA_END=1504 /DNA_ORIENTATION=+